METGLKCGTQCPAFSTAHDELFNGAPPLFLLYRPANPNAKNKKYGSLQPYFLKIELFIFHPVHNSIIPRRDLAFWEIIDACLA
jgi:hypothetical protein